MRAVSAQWLAAIKGSHHAVFEVRAIAPGQSGTNPTGVTIPIEGGDVQYDIESDVLATVEVWVADPALFPTGPADLLAPYGNELFVRRGIDYGNGTIEWVSLGYFRINAAEQDDARGGTFRVSGQDRMCRIIADKMGANQIGGSETYGEFIEELVTGGIFRTGTYPDATIQWDSTTARDSAIGKQIEWDGNRWQIIEDLVKGLSKIWYWDHRGVLVIKSPPSTTTPVWTAAAGEGGVLTSLGRSLSDEGLYNYVHVTGGAPGPGTSPPSNEAYDEDPASPTYYFGPYGRSSLFVTEDTCTTSAQTTALANALLRSSLGVGFSLDFSAIPNAALEPYDPVRVRLNDTQDATYIIRQLTIPLSVEQPLTAETRTAIV